MIIFNPHIKGDTFLGAQFQIEINERNGMPVIPIEYLNLDNCQIICTFKLYNNVHSVFDLNNGIVIVDSNLGIFNLLPNVILDWNLGNYYFDIDIISPEGIRKTYIYGLLKIVDDSTLSINEEFPNLFVPERIKTPLESPINNYYGGCLGEENICSTSILYCDEPWIDPICAPYIINQGSMSPNLEFIVMQKKDFFGDKCYMDLTDFDVFIFIYNEDNLLKIKGKCDFINRKQGFIKYKWDKFDTLDTGNFSCIFKLIHNSGEEIIITNKDNRVDIIIR